MNPVSAKKPTAAERALAVELTALVLSHLAPEEIVVLDETAAEYFDDPEAALRPTAGDTPLGSGIEVAMITPYLLAASGVVLPVLGGVAGELSKDIAKDLVKDPIARQVRRLFRRQPDEVPGPNALSTEQTTRVRQAILAKCHAVGLPAPQAALIADATVGSLHTRS